MVEVHTLHKAPYATPLPSIPKSFQLLHPSIHHTPPSFIHPSTTHLLLPKRAALRQPRLPSRRLTQHLRAPRTHHHSLGVREDGRDGEAPGALDVHEVGSRGGNESLWRLDPGGEGGNGQHARPETFKPRTHLELVLARFGGGRGIEEIDGENLRGGRDVSFEQGDSGGVRRCRVRRGVGWETGLRTILAGRLGVGVWRFGEFASCEGFAERRRWGRR